MTERTHVQGQPFDWPGALAAYRAAAAAAAGADRVLAELSADFEEIPRLSAKWEEPFALGLDLARRRAKRVSSDLAAATFALTGGRPLYEVMWFVPDDL